MAVTGPRSAVRGLGEIALRVDDLDRMERFYRDVVGLELLRRFPKAVFFKIAEGFAGHTQVLALFDRSGERPGLRVDAERSTIDHLAFEIALEDFEAEKKRLEEHGLAVETAEHPWVRWRSLYVRDPEGNTVEWVCHDDSVDGGGPAGARRRKDTRPSRGGRVRTSGPRRSGTEEARSSRAAAHRLAEERWASQVGPYQVAAETLGCRFLDRGVQPWPNDVFTFVDVLLLEPATFLDFVGNVVLGAPQRGIPDGPGFVQMRTWKSRPGAALHEVDSIAELKPGPRAPGLVPRLVQSVLSPFLRSSLPRQYRPFPLRAPRDLARAIRRHEGFVSAAPGTVLVPAGDPLEWRRAHEAAGDEPAQDDPGGP